MKGLLEFLIQKGRRTLKKFQGVDDKDIKVCKEEKMKIKDA